ncbi:MAG TPA: hypothetical protein VMJ10_25220 [Kofleriaceae bacterium]|nr:hypothetical protein [Kofleriaceae bacterium]
MGRFYAIVLVLAAACGDNIVPPPAPPAPTGYPTTGHVNIAQIPEVCGYQAWASTQDPTVPMQLAVATTTDEVELVTTPLAGGRLHGIAVVPTNKTPLELPLPVTGSWTAMSRASGRVVINELGASGMAIDVLGADLASSVQIMQLPGLGNAVQSVVDVDNSHVLPYVNGSGVWLQQLDDTWHPASLLQVVSTDAQDPIEGLTVAPAGGAALVGWGTTGDCSLATVFAMDRPAEIVHAGFACEAPRIAADAATGTGALVFQTQNDVFILNASSMAKGQLLRANATAPRIMFDGQRTWASYLDIHGDIVVGFLAGDGSELISTALEGIRPQASGYELAMFEGQPWVFAYDSNGYTAHRLCVVDAVD